MIKACAYGEISLKFNPDENTSFSSIPQKLNFFVSSPEAYFLSNITNFKNKATLITAVHDDFLKDLIFRQLNMFKINTSNIILSKKGRNPIIFEDSNQNFLKKIHFDRKSSLIDTFDFEEYNFKNTFLKCNHFHISAITPSLSNKAMYNCIRALRLAKEMELETSCNLNFNSNFWNYKTGYNKIDPERIITEIGNYCDFLSGDIEDIKKIFNFETGNNTNYNLSHYENILLNLSKRFPHAKVAAIIISKNSNDMINFGSVLYIREINQFYFSPNNVNKFKFFKVKKTNDINGIKEAFSAGLVYGLNKYKSPQHALDFALSNSILKYNYKSGFNYSSLEEIKLLMNKIKTKQIYF
ncbi:MAG: hypothetical protein JXB50_15185 [Spirochaetes bacterium]|nr:hypothetical protein [Spirochaetota bacterium]